MLHLINIFLISVCWVVILDLSGFGHTIKKLIWKFLRGTTQYPDTFNPRPITCSLCMTFWTAVIYLLCVHSVTIPYITYSLLIALFTSNTRGLIIWIKDILTI